MGTISEPGTLRESFEELAFQHLDALNRFARGLAHNPADADDLVQESCLRAFRRFERFRPGTNFRAWIFTILRNVAINQHKRRQAQGVPLPMEQIEPTLTAHPEHSSVDGSQSFTPADLRAAMERLPDDYRTTLTLAYVDGFTYAEVAAILDCPIGTVMSRIFRARRRLREYLNRNREAFRTPQTCSA